MFKKIQKLLTVLLLGGLIVTSCKNDLSSVDNSEPPKVPAVKTMTIDLSTFENNQNAKEGAAKQVGNNFSQAVARAFIFKAVVDINLAIPRVLLKAASNSAAELNEDDKWVWSYSKTADGEMYEVRLVAVREGPDEVSWEFFVTNSSLNIEDQLFFSGTTNNEATNGIWTYYNVLSNQEQTAVSEITWSIDDDENVDLRLEVLGSQHNNQGDFIEYSFDGTIKNVVYFNADKDETTELQWNIQTNAGFIIAPGYNNGEQACWNENFEDVSCS